MDGERQRLGIKPSHASSSACRPVLVRSFVRGFVWDVVMVVAMAMTVTMAMTVILAAVWN